MSRVKTLKEHEHEYNYEDRVRDDKRENKIRQEEHETKNYGTITYQRDPRDSKYHKIIAVPVEIEVPWEVDQLVKLDILATTGQSYAEWVEQCYHERMKQILTDPAEFGKVVLWHIKRGHCFEDDDL